MARSTFTGRGPSLVQLAVSNTSRFLPWYQAASSNQENSESGSPVHGELEERDNEEGYNSDNREEGKDDESDNEGEDDEPEYDELADDDVEGGNDNEDGEGVEDENESEDESDSIYSPRKKRARSFERSSAVLHQIKRPRNSTLSSNVRVSQEKKSRGHGKGRTASLKAVKTRSRHAGRSATPGTTVPLELESTISGKPTVEYDSENLLRATLGPPGMQYSVVSRHDY